MSAMPSLGRSLKGAEEVNRQGKVQRLEELGQVAGSGAGGGSGGYEAAKAGRESRGGAGEHKVDGGEVEQQPVEGRGGGKGEGLGCSSE